MFPVLDISPLEIINVEEADTILISNRWTSGPKLKLRFFVPNDNYSFQNEVLIGIPSYIQYLLIPQTERALRRECFCPSPVPHDS